MDARDPRSTDDESAGRSWLDPTSLSTRLRVWVRWIGAGRIAAAVGATVVIVAAVWWLVRSPAPPTEARLPVASHAATVAVGDGSGPDAGPITVAEPTTAVAPAELTVHVAGAVAAPGVYVLPSGARVVDAIAAAGGALPDGDPDGLNLAAPVADGDRIAVATVGATPGAGEGGISHAAAGSVPAGPLDVNTATVDELDALPGVGPATAAAIVAHREANGPFASVAELEEVRGIGPAKLDALRGLVTV